MNLGRKDILLGLGPMYLSFNLYFYLPIYLYIYLFLELGSSVNLGRKDVLFGLGLILEMKDCKDLDILMAHTSILEDIYSHLIQAVQQAYVR